MARGTLANIRLKNLLVAGVEGGRTLHLPDGEQMDIFDAAVRYRKEGVPLVILAGKEYGTGSSRDWAAKGVLLLGVRAVIAGSFERIHRANLAGMGVLPLQFLEGQGVQFLRLTGEENFSIPRFPVWNLAAVDCHRREERGDDRIEFQVRLRVDSLPGDGNISQGGILKKAFIDSITSIEIADRRFYNTQVLI